MCRENPPLFPGSNRAGRASGAPCAGGDAPASCISWAPPPEAGFPAERFLACRPRRRPRPPRGWLCWAGAGRDTCRNFRSGRSPAPSLQGPRANPVRSSRAGRCPGYRASPGSLKRPGRVRAPMTAHAHARRLRSPGPSSDREALFPGRADRHDADRNAAEVL